MSEFKITVDRVRRAMKIDQMPLLAREHAEIIQIIELKDKLLAENAELKKELSFTKELMATEVRENNEWLNKERMSLQSENFTLRNQLTDAVTSLEQCEKLFKEMLEDPELDFQGVEHHYELHIAGLVVKIQTLLKLKGGG